MARRWAGMAAVLGFLAALGVGGCVSPAEPPTGPALLAAGNANNLYVVHAGIGREGDRFRFWQRDAAGIWHACGTGRGRPVTAAAWREHLILFFPSGRWGRFGLDRPIIEPAPAPTWRPVAACEAGLEAYALGFTAADEAALFRFADGRWSAEPEIVAGLDRATARGVDLVRFGDRLFIVWREEVQDFPAAGSPFRLRFLIRRPDGAWQGPLVSRLRVASACQVAAGERSMVCLYRKPAPEGEPEPWFLAGYVTADEDWHEVGPVEGLPAEGPVVLARAGEGVVVVRLEAGRPQVAPLDPQTARLGEFAPVEVASAPPPRPAWGLVLAAAGMAFVMMWLLLRRGRLGTGWEAPLREGVGRTDATAGRPPAGAWVSAPLLRRGVAVLVDYLVVLGGAAVFLPLVAPDLVEAVAQMAPERPVPWGALVTLEAIRIGLLVLYFTAAEASTGRTLGKALVGLVVRTERGDPIAFWQALVRSLLRPVDELPAFYLLGLALVVTGRRPQRLGDRLARTLVVRPLPGG